MLIAHISDSHIAGFGEKAYGVAPTAENLSLCVNHINRLRPQPDCVLVTGDITFDGLMEEVQRTSAILKKLNYPFYVVPGNHDDRATLFSEFSKNHCPANNENFINYVIEDYEIRLIGMDSTIPDAPGGEICTQQAQWLETRLADQPEQPTIIFMHHPPVNCGVLETDEDGFKGTKRLGDIIAKYANIERILCGHIHLEAHIKWCETIVSTAPSMGLQLNLDLTLKKPSQFYVDSPGYQLHFYHQEKHLISHTVYVKDRNGPYLF
ncbi:MAG: phosphodiesterase [Desulfobacula sp.]|jgi:3',5'-cyclic-AMP phosphodiesterase|nr:phosphodiesterase [Desulfobacula sp.]MBT7260833.1 phosphodiesterase [Desulfobacula sp.]